MRKTGEEALQFNGKDLGLRLCDFWSWGVFRPAGTIHCGAAIRNSSLRLPLGIDLSEPRVNWEPWDLTFRSEQGDIHVEVKSASYFADVGAGTSLRYPVQHPSGYPMDSDPWLHGGAASAVRCLCFLRVYGNGAPKGKPHAAEKLGLLRSPHQSSGRTLWRTENYPVEFPAPDSSRES